MNDKLKRSASLHSGRSKKYKGKEQEVKLALPNKKLNLNLTSVMFNEMVIGHIMYIKTFDKYYPYYRSRYDIPVRQTFIYYLGESETMEEAQRKIYDYKQNLSDLS